jgi:acetylornithine deacetylase
MFRTVGDAADLRHLLSEHLGTLVSLEDVLIVPPVKLTTVPGFDTAVFSFTTDIPFLDDWGAPLLVGPGSITVAHTADEYIEIAELEKAVEIYVGLARGLMSQSG